MRPKKFKQYLLMTAFLTGVLLPNILPAALLHRNMTLQFQD